MKKFPILIAGGALALAIPALAQMHDGHHAAKGGMHAMSGPTARADVEAAVRSHFTAVDANKDGQVTQEEIQAMRSAHRAERREGHFKAMDKDGNGQISKAEFDSAHSDDMASRQGDRRSHRGPMAGKHHGEGKGQRGMMGGGAHFTQADADKDGRVSLSEALATRLARFDAADSDKNGVLTAEERMNARQARRKGSSDQ